MIYVSTFIIVCGTLKIVQPTRPLPIFDVGEMQMGPGTSSDVLVIFYVIIGLVLALLATGLILHRTGRLRGQRAGLVFALLCISPILVGIIWYVSSVP